LNGLVFLFYVIPNYRFDYQYVSQLAGILCEASPSFPTPYHW